MILYLRKDTLSSWCHYTGGCHVLPRQEVWSPHLSATGPEPLGRRPLPSTRPCHTRTSRPTPRQRPTRCPPRLRSTLRPVPVAPVRPGPRPPARAHHTFPRSGFALRAPVAPDRLSGRPGATPRRPPLLVSSGTGPLPDGSPSLGTTGQ